MVTDLLSQAYIYIIYGGSTKLDSIRGTNIIVQTIIHHCSKVFTNGQARVNPKHCVIKCVGGQSVFHYIQMAF